VEQLNETQRYLVEEHVEEYQDGRISRRELLRRVTLISGSAALAATIVAACGPATSGVGAPASSAGASAAPTATTAPSPSPYATPPAAATADGVTVKENDPRITVSKPDLRGADGASLMAYMARPAGNARVPGVVVIHENRGQTEHIRDVVRRAATAGFAAVNVDLVARAGGAAKLTDQAAYNAELGKLTLQGKLADHSATIAFLKGQSSGSIGVVGFCFGGGEVWSLVAAGADLKAGVPFYGPQPSNFAEIAKTKTAVSAVYAEQDTRITGTGPQMVEQLKKAGVPYQITVYPGVNHAFHNDTNADRYNAPQAQKAWVQTIEWFKRNLA
jgi:carboxymethylenebutenolidase